MTDNKGYHTNLEMSGDRITRLFASLTARLVGGAPTVFDPTRVANPLTAPGLG